MFGKKNTLPQKVTADLTNIWNKKLSVADGTKGIVVGRHYIKDMILGIFLTCFSHSFPMTFQGLLPFHYYTPVFSMLPSFFLFKKVYS